MTTNIFFNSKLARGYILIFTSLVICYLGIKKVFALEPLDVVTAPNEIIVVENYIYFEILWPETLMYTFKLNQARDFGTDKLHEKVDLIISDPENACKNFYNDVRGAVVLIRRGECSFLSKSKLAERAGALAAIIYDNDEENDSSMIEMIQDDTFTRVHIPAFFLLGKDGAIIKRQLHLVDSDRAVINIPVNLTGKPYYVARRPPWTVW